MEEVDALKVENAQLRLELQKSKEFINNLNYVKLLYHFFDRFDNSNAYFYIDLDSAYYRQSGKSIAVPFNIHYDFKKSGYLSITDIIKNKEVIFKLGQYCYDNLISFIPNKYGYEVMVITKSGELIYHQYIKFISILNPLSKWILNRKYPELYLNNYKRKSNNNVMYK